VLLAGVDVNEFLSAKLFNREGHEAFREGLKAAYELVIIFKLSNLKCQRSEVRGQRSRLKAKSQKLKAKSQT
jgi:hypothetical protein